MSVTPSGFDALPLSIAQLSLAAVLKCGQSFRWTAYPLLPPGPSHEYRFCLKDRAVCLQQTTDTLFYRTAYPDPQPNCVQRALKNAETLVWLNDYFQLDVDIVDLYKEWALKDAIFASVQGRFGGIRMLRQDPWENLVSYVVSFWD
jgi:N-glycosylase/DNA lyase